MAKKPMGGCEIQSRSRNCIKNIHWSSAYKLCLSACESARLYFSVMLCVNKQHSLMQNNLHMDFGFPGFWIILRLFKTIPGDEDGIGDWFYTNVVTTQYHLFVYVTVPDCLDSSIIMVLGSNIISEGWKIIKLYNREMDTSSWIHSTNYIKMLPFDLSNI